jgi:hypothetical protein
MRIFYLMFTVIIFLLPSLAEAKLVSSINLQQGEVLTATISSPFPGQAVQGAVVIRGDTSVDGFQSYEVDFAYSADATQTWFLIQESTLPIQDGILAVWDTSTITDGNYDLRMIITRTEGEQMEIQVFDLHVRNYTPIETDTPMPTKPYVTLAPGIPTLTATPQTTSVPMVTSLPPTPTILPTNPAEISTSQVMLTFGTGAAFTIGIFAILGAYVGIHTVVHNRK